jgi:hypothetical protein
MFLLLLGRGRVLARVLLNASYFLYVSTVGKYKTFIYALIESTKIYHVEKLIFIVRSRPFHDKARERN